MKSWVRKCAQGLVAAAACGYIAYELWLRSSQVISYFGDAASYVRIFTCGLGYGVSLLIAALAWRELVRRLKSDREPVLSLQTGLTIFALSNMLKYLPTNVLHVAGRYAALRRLEFSRRTAILSLVSEPMLMIGLASILALSVGYPMLRSFVSSNSLLLTFAVGAALVVGVATALFALRREIVGSFVRSIQWRKTARAAGCVLPCYFVFFVWNGVLLTGLLGGPVDTHTLAGVIGVSASAWTVGLITPGAPAGLGVREAIIMAGLTRLGHAGDAFIAAMAFRFATTIGDCLAALAAGAAVASAGRMGPAGKPGKKT